MRTQLIRSSHVNKGDFIVRRGGRIWKIVGLRRTKLKGASRRCFRMDYVSGGRPPRNDKNVSLKFFEWEMVEKALILRCFPCYDSDCACVFDQVSN